MKVIDVAIGLSLMFILATSLASAMLEGISRKLGSRSKNLFKHLQKLLDGDSDLPERTMELYGTEEFQAMAPNRWVATRPRPIKGYSGPDSTNPTLLAAKGPDRVDSKLLTEMVEQAWRPPNNAPATSRVSSQTTELQVQTVMDEASHAYRVRSRWWLFGLGLAFAVTANIDTITVTQTLWGMETYEQVVEVAESCVAAGNSEAPDDTETSDTSGGSDQDATSRCPEAVADLDFPIGWEDCATKRTTVLECARGAIAESWMGWLLTALGVSLGAPFWYDVLNRTTRLRTQIDRRPESTNPGG